MNNKTIIGLIGEKGAGKGLVSKFLIENFNAIHYGTSKILRRTIEDLHLPATRDNFVKLAIVLKEGFGPSVVIDSLIKDMEKNGSDIIIADGIRMHGDVKPFREKYGDSFHLIYVTADLKIRYERSKKRNEKAGEDKMTLSDFVAEEGRLTEVSIHEIGKKADYLIDNNGTLEELNEQIIKTIKDILGK